MKMKAIFTLAATLIFTSWATHASLAGHLPTSTYNDNGPQGGQSGGNGPQGGQSGGNGPQGGQSGGNGPQGGQ